MHKIKYLIVAAYVCIAANISMGAVYKPEIITHQVILKQFAQEVDPQSIRLTPAGTPVGDKVRTVQRYTAWPALTKAPNGDLVVAFSGDRDNHCCPWGKLQIIRSSDMGNTWSAPVTISNTPLDDRDAGMLTTAKGTVVINWFTSTGFKDNARFHKLYYRHCEKLPDETIKKWLGYWILRSEDNGNTWGEPIRVQGSSPASPIQLSDGRLLLIGKDYHSNPVRLTVEESADDGRSWQLLSVIPADKKLAAILHEPHCIEIDKDRIIAMFRQTGDEKLEESFMFQSTSVDGGKTWAVPAEINICGFPPHLLKLHNGWILCSYGRRFEPYGQRACISTDGGKTWDVENEIILRDDAPNTDLGYPVSIQLEDKTIMTVYYQVEKAGEKPSLMTTHWKLKNIQ